MRIKIAIGLAAKKERPRSGGPVGLCQLVSLKRHSLAAKVPQVLRTVPAALAHTGARSSSSFAGAGSTLKVRPVGKHLLTLRPREKIKCWLSELNVDTPFIRVIASASQPPCSDAAAAAVVAAAAARSDHDEATLSSPRSLSALVSPFSCSPPLSRTIPVRPSVRLFLDYAHLPSAISNETRATAHSRLASFLLS